MKKSKKTKVLIIDDEKFFRDVLGKEFSESGFEVFTAEDGGVGFEVYQDVKPDVVIVDKVMPNVGGTRFLKMAHEISWSKDVIFVTVSSMIKEPPHEHNRDVLGSRIHIPKFTKPVDIVILVEQLITRKVNS